MKLLRTIMQEEPSGGSTGMEGRDLRSGESSARKTTGRLISAKRKSYSSDFGAGFIK